MFSSHGGKVGRFYMALWVNEVQLSYLEAMKLVIMISS